MLLNSIYVSLKTLFALLPVQLHSLPSFICVLERANCATHRFQSCISMCFSLFPLTSSISSHISYMGKVAQDKCSWNLSAHHTPTAVMFKHTAGLICILSDSVVYWDRNWPFAILNSFPGDVGTASPVNQCFSTEAACLLGGIISCLRDIASWVVSCVLLGVTFKGAHLSVMFEWRSVSLRVQEDYVINM